MLNQDYSEKQIKKEFSDELKISKETYFYNLENFCNKYSCNIDSFKQISKVFFTPNFKKIDWNQKIYFNFQLINGFALPMELSAYKRLVLDPLLHSGRKEEWIDLSFVKKEYEIEKLKLEITNEWRKIKI